MKRITTLLVTLLFITGCIGPSVNTRLLVKGLTPRTKAAPLRIYENNTRPKCPYEKIAEITVKQKTQYEGVMTALKKEAKRVGGDGLINIKKSKRGLVSISAFDSEPDESQMLVTVHATVIRFKDPSCTEPETH